MATLSAASSQIRYVFVVGVRSPTAPHDDSESDDEQTAPHYETAEAKIHRMLRPGSLVAVRPTASGAFYRGSPVPEVIELETATPATLRSAGATLLGVAVRPPIPAGDNFGMPLAVTSLAIRGGVELHAEHRELLRNLLKSELGSSRPSAAWTPLLNRSLLLAPHEDVLVLK